MDAVGVELREIPLDRVHPTPDNTRIIPKDWKRDPKLLELADSIRQIGVLEPALVRPHPDLPGHYDLRAGHRRLLASRLAGRETIPALVRQMDDRTALEITVVENLQRQDLHPLEQGRAIALMLERGWTLEQAATQLGMSATWTARRARLAELSERWQALIADPEIGVGGWSAAHLELIARFPTQSQDRLIEVFDWRNRERGHYYYNFRDHNTVLRCSLADLRREISGYLHALAAAPWKLDDATLVPACGACRECPHRSDREPRLWDAGDLGLTEDSAIAEDARCLDPECWAEKAAAVVDIKQAELRAKTGKEPLRITNDWRSENKEAGIYRDHMVSRCPKSARGARPIIHVDGPKAGSWFWGCVGSAHSTSSTTADGKPAPKPLKERRAQYAKTRFKIVLDQIEERIRDLEDSEDLHAVLCSANTSDEWRGVVLCLVLAYGVERGEWDGDYYDAWEIYEKARGLMDDRARTERLARHCLPHLRTAICGTRNSLGAWSGVEPDACEEVKLICRCLGIDFEALTRAAEAEKPYPKSWESLNEDGTPKKAGADNGKLGKKGAKKTTPKRDRMHAAAGDDTLEDGDE
jgi:ParB/RepB/Spo0J family partition protein